MAIESQGMSIKIGDGATPTEGFTDINSVKSISGPSGSASVIDITTLASTAKEKMMGLKDEGQVSLNINFNPSEATHLALLTARTNKTKTNFQLHFTDASNTVYNFAGYVLSVPVNSGVDAVVEGSVTIEISGEITITTTP